MQFRTTRSTLTRPTSGSRRARRLAVAVVLAAFAGGAFAPPASVLANQPNRTREMRAEHPETTIVVRGQGEVMLKPDRATVTFGASAQASDAADAQREVNRVVGLATEAIKKLDVDGLTLQTSQLSLYPVYDNRARMSNGNEEPRPIGYRATMTIAARLDAIDQVGPVIDTALKSGINRLEGISFGLIDDGPAHREALAKAVREARDKAGTIAGAMETELGAAIEVIEDGATIIEPQRRFSGRESYVMADGGNATPIEMGEVRVSAGVTIRYSSRSRRPE